MENKMKTNKTLTELFVKYNMKDVAAKMVKDLAKATPQEIGRAILSTKKPGQRIVNLQK